MTTIYQVVSFKGRVVSEWENKEQAVNACCIENMGSDTTTYHVEKKTVSVPAFDLPFPEFA